MDVEAFTRAGHALGLALASVANLIGPDCPIISGEGVASYDLFAEQIRQTFTAQAFGAAAECELIVRPLPFEEWARGGAAIAAWLYDFLAEPRIVQMPIQAAVTHVDPDAPASTRIETPAATR